MRCGREEGDGIYLKGQTSFFFFKSDRVRMWCKEEEEVKPDCSPLLVPYCTILYSLIWINNIYRIIILLTLLFVIKWFYVVVFLQHHCMHTNTTQYL